MGELINLNTDASTTNLKTKVLTGTTAPVQGSSVLIPHGLTVANIRGFSIMVSQAMGALIRENNQNGVGAGSRFDAAIVGANLFVVNVADQSSSILSRPITAIIFHV